MNNRFGKWATISALVTSVGYAIPQLLQVAGILVDPWDRILIFAPSLALATAFVLTMVALHVTTAPAKQIWSFSALALAIMYGVMVSIVYVTQLAIVIPHEFRGDASGVALIKCCNPGQFLTAVDLLGYTLMSLATLFAAPVFVGIGVGRTVRIWFIANGILAPFLFMQFVFPQLIYIGALWLITFPTAMFFLALYFLNEEKLIARN